MRLTDPEDDDDWEYSQEGEFHIRKRVTSGGRSEKQVLLTFDTTRESWAPATVLDPRPDGEYIRLTELNPSGYKFKFLATWSLLKEEQKKVDLEKADHLSFTSKHWDWAEDDRGAGSLTVTKGKIIPDDVPSGEFATKQERENE